MGKVVLRAGALQLLQLRTQRVARTMQGNPDIVTRQAHPPGNFVATATVHLIQHEYIALARRQFVNSRQQPHRQLLLFQLAYGVVNWRGHRGQFGIGITVTQPRFGGITPVSIHHLVMQYGGKPGA